MNRIVTISIALASLCLGTVAASACPSVQYNRTSISLNPDMRDCAYNSGQQAGHNGSRGRYFIGQATQQRREAELRQRYLIELRKLRMTRVTRTAALSTGGGMDRKPVVGPPRRVIPPGSGQVTINREFDTGQEYCNAHVPGTTFSHWIGSGGDRKARCTD